MLVRPERNQNLAIEGADGRGVTHRDVYARIGQTDVVENIGEFGLRNHAPDGVFDLGEILLGLFDAGAGGGADVHADLAGIHLREEILPQHWGERETDRNQNEEARGEQLAMRERGG